MLSTAACNIIEPQRQKTSAGRNEIGEPVIFVVEDDLRVRHFICTLLRHMTSAHVSDTVDPFEALSMSCTLDGRVELLISDVNLRASMSGIDLARRLMAANPFMKVLLMSAADCPLSTIPETWRFLAKPFALDNFVNCFRALSHKGLRSWARDRDALFGRAKRP
jgi:DNA-binding NtrC family response regulator